MCLAVPMKVLKIEADNWGLLEIEGVRNKVNLSLVEGVQVGDYVIVHAGFAIEKMNEEEAKTQIEMLQGLVR